MYMPPPYSPYVFESRQEGIYAVYLSDTTYTPGSGESEYSDDQLDGAYIIQVWDWFGNKSFFTTVCKFLRCDGRVLS